MENWHFKQTTNWEQSPARMMEAAPSLPLLVPPVQQYGTYVAPLARAQLPGKETTHCLGSAHDRSVSSISMPV